MTDLLKLILGVLASLFRSRARLEAENLVLRQQINVLRRRMPKRPDLNNTDRVLFVWLYRWFPSVLGAVAIVRPETVIRWHRAGFRAYWRWRSHNRVGRPKVSAELRTLIGNMSRANPLWGAPRIHGELLKLGFEVAQSTGRSVHVPPLGAPISGLADVSQQSCRRHRRGRSFCRPDDCLPDPILPCRSASWTTGLDIVWRNGKSDRGVDIAPDYRGFPMGPCASIPHQGSGCLVRAGLRATSVRHGHSGSTGRTPIAVAKRICREAHRLDPPGMPGPHDRIRRSAPAPKRRRVCCLLQ